MTIDELGALMEAYHYMANIRFISIDEQLSELRIENIVKTGGDDDLNPGTMWIMLSPIKKS